LVSATVIAAWSPSLPAAPWLESSSYLGGSQDDVAQGVALDSNGCVYICGYTNSPDFPTFDAYQSSLAGSIDAFVSKFSSNGRTLLYSTFLGGSGLEQALNVTADEQEGAIVVGSTESADFPATAWAWQTAYSGGGSDAFVARISSTGGGLYFSSYLGGSGLEQAQGVAFDASGWIYVTGYTTSNDFPTCSYSDPVQSARAGNYDAFVTQFAPGGGSLYYSTYLGGSGADAGWGIAVDSDNCAYVVGQTFSGDFPTSFSIWPASPSLPASSGFVSKLSNYGDGLIFSTYLGGSWVDSAALAVALDDYQQARVAGYTYALDFPTLNPVQAYNHGGSDAFVSLFSSSGGAVLFSTYLGGSQNDSAAGIAVDPYYGDSHICGSTQSSDFPTENPYQDAIRGARDAFYTILHSDGDRLQYSTYLGGSGEDWGYAVAWGRVPDERVWLAGCTDSADLPLRRAYQGTFGGGTGDAFFAGFVWDTPSEPNRYHTDFNGDGTSDIAIFRGSSGLWAVHGLTRVYFGTSSDRPVPADFDGDGTTEFAVFRNSTSLWAVRGRTRAYFGSAGGVDFPIPQDYDGDGTAEIAVFRNSSGLWAVRGLTRIYFGDTIDNPLPGPYRGDEAADPAVFRASSGLWAVRGWTRMYFGSTWDTAIPGDYNGDDAWEPGIFRSSSGLWSLRGLTRIYFGSSSDVPVPADYAGGGEDQAAVFRVSSGLWWIRGETKIYHGSTGDVPVTR